MKLSDLMTGETLENSEKIRKLEKEIKILKQGKTSEKIEEEEIKRDNLKIILYITILIMMIIEMIVICNAF